MCGLNAAEAWKIYQYGPDHPLSKKILKHKIRDSSLKKLKKKEQEKMMKKLFLEGIMVTVNQEIDFEWAKEELHMGFAQILKEKSAFEK